MITCFDNSISNGRKISTLVDLLSYRAEDQSSSMAYTFLARGETETDRLTCRELNRRARAIAAKLQSLNAAGSRALLLYPPGLEFITAFFGCLYASVVAVPAYPPRRNQNTFRLQALIKDAQASFALTTTSLLIDIRHQFTQDVAGIKMQWLASDNIASDLAEVWQEPEVSSDTLAFLQYTSGSTGTPKGVMVSHGNLLHNSALIYQCFGHTTSSQGVIWLPPYHDMGLIGGVLQPLYGGFPVTLMSSVDFLQKPLRWLRAISHYKATTSGGPNFAYDLCIRRITLEQRESLDLSSWEVAFNGAEPIQGETLDQFAAVFKSCGFRKEAFYPCYGMAETTLIVSGGIRATSPVACKIERASLKQNQVVVAQGEEDSRTVVGCGQMCLDQKAIIVDPQSLSLCSSDEVGEIWVSGQSIAQGYWNRVEETQQAFRAYLADTGEGPFLRTGDLGFLQDGELFVTGRLKDVIIIRGRNYYPQDIELTVEKSHPALKLNSGAAFGVEVKGEERLVVVQEVERSYLRKLNVKEVVENIRQAVAEEHALQVYATVLVKTGSIFKTSSGKIRRHACRTSFLNGNLNVVEDWSENPEGKAKFIHLQAEIESVLQKLSSCNQVSKDTEGINNGNRESSPC